MIISSSSGKQQLHSNWTAKYGDGFDIKSYANGERGNKANEQHLT